MPNWAQNKLSVIAHTEEEICQFIKDADDSVSPFSFRKLVPLDIPEKYETTDIQQAKWGVKWGDCDAELVGKTEYTVSYKFSTAWGPACEFHTKLSEKYPKLLFALSFGEEFLSRGRMTYKNGIENILSCSNSPDETEDDPKKNPSYIEHTQSEEEWDINSQLYQDWECKYLNTHEDWVKEFITERFHSGILM